VCWSRYRDQHSAKTAAVTDSAGLSQIYDHFCPLCGMMAIGDRIGRISAETAERTIGRTQDSFGAFLKVLPATLMGRPTSLALLATLKGCPAEHH